MNLHETRNEQKNVFTMSPTKMMPYFLRYVAAIIPLN